MTAKCEQPNRSTRIISEETRDIQNSKDISERFALDAKYNGISKSMWKEFKELELQYRPAVDLCYGSPDFTPAQEIVDKWTAYCSLANNSEMHQYSPQSGHPRLVNVLAKLYGKILNRVIDPNKEIIITIGASNALFCSIMSNIGNDEEVILIEPHFDIYENLVKMAGGKPVFIPLRQMDPTDESSASWKLDMRELESLFNSKTKAIILNNPTNPLGKVFSKSELIEIANLCKKYKVLILSDEVYEWFVFEGTHERVSSILWDQTVTIGSIGKTFGLTGWRIGWAFGPSYLIRNLQVAFSNGIYEAETPSQEIIAITLEAEIPKLGTPESIFTKLKVDLEKRRNQLIQIVRDCGMKPIVPQGGIFVIANWKSLAPNIDWKEPKNEEERDDVRFVHWLVKHRNLLVIPPSLFYCPAHKDLAQDYIRLCFFRKTETLLKAREIFMALKTSQPAIEK